MVFSSLIFLFAFLPCCLIGYYGIFRKSRKWQNYFLLICSLLFYSWGGVKYTGLILLSILINWLMALLIDNSGKKEKKNEQLAWLTIAVIFNIALLFVFKYVNFTVDNLNALFHLDIQIKEIALPIGISFFTFQGMSYVIDVFRKHGEALKNPLEVGLYISFFPQLIAGPIVRYETVADQIHNRRETVDLFSNGIGRFIIGLGKKAILANTLAVISDQVFSQYYTASGLSAWLGAIAYTLQIYFDFSGYSDMAIGLGKMFGFTFEENFDHPYLSSSITEFWRRWHISMGTWFRDYVYFPLGGSRVSSKARVIFNLFVVWMLTGIWHGANWTFILWGMLQFLVIFLERMTKINKSTSKGLRCFGHIYSLLVVIFGWVLFNSASVLSAWDYIKSMFFVGIPLADDYFFFAIKENAVVLVLSVLCCFPLIPWLQKNNRKEKQWYGIGRFVVLSLIMVVAVAYVVKGAFNPFIYFNF